MHRVNRFLTPAHGVCVSVAASETVRPHRFIGHFGVVLIVAVAHPAASRDSLKFFSG